MERPPQHMLALNAPQYDIFYDEMRCEFAGSILCRVIELDDEEALKEYLVLRPNQLRGPRGVFSYRLCWAPDAFEYAAQCGAIKVLRHLLDYELQHPRKKLRFGHGVGGYGLLNIACRYGRLDMAKYLLEESKNLSDDIAFRDGDGWTPLLAATAALSCPISSYSDQSREAEGAAKYVDECEELVNLLLDEGAASDDRRVRRFEREKGGRFYEAERRKRWTEDYFSEEPDDSDNLPEGTGDVWDMPPPDEEMTCLVETVLSLAVPKARPAIIRRLIDEGADVHAQVGSPNGGELDGLPTTPLHIAARYLNTPAIEQLFKNRDGQELQDMLSYRDSTGHTPLHLAVIGFQTSRFPNNQINECLTPIFQLFLAHSSKDIVNAQDDFARAALHYVMLAGVSEFGTIHVPTSPGPSATRSDGKSMLHIWAHHGLACPHPVAAEMLEEETLLLSLFTEQGVSVTDPDDSGNTALHYAALGLPRPAAVRLLLRLGAAADAVNNAGDTPLHVAADMTRAFRNTNVGFDAALKLQDETMRIILDAVKNSGSTTDLMKMQNASGKTPLGIRDESRKKRKAEMVPPPPRGPMIRGGRMFFSDRPPVVIGRGR